MTDVLKIALDKRAELNEEIEKLDGFIRMAEALIRASHERGSNDGDLEMPRRPAQVTEPTVRTAIRRGEGTEQEEAGSVQRPQVIRRTSPSVAATG